LRKRSKRNSFSVGPGEINMFSLDSIDKERREEGGDFKFCIQLKIIILKGKHV